MRNVGFGSTHMQYGIGTITHLFKSIGAVLCIATLGLQLSACGQSNQMKSESSSSDITKEVSPPVAKKVPYPMTQHGHTRVDDYYWMRDDSRTDKDVLAHLEAENAYLKNQLAHTETLQKTLFDELVGRLEKDDSSVPYLDDGYWWMTKYEGDSEYPIYARRKVGSEQEEVLLDVNQLAQGQDYFEVGDFAVSQNDILAYTTDTNGRLIFDVQFRNLKTGEMLPDKLENASDSIVWANDNQHVFYVKKHPQTLLDYQVYRHKIGTPQQDDVLMYEEKDDTFWTGIGKSRDDSLIYIWHSSTTTAGNSYLDADNPTGQFQFVTPREEGHEYSFEKHGDWFYIKTNDQAKNFKIAKVKVAESSDRSKWQDVISHQEDVFIEDFIVLDDFLVVEEKSNGLVQMRVLDLATGKVAMLPFKEQAFFATFDTNRQMSAKDIRIEYSSMTTPDSILEYNLTDLSYKTLKQDKILGGFDSENYRSERILIPARDGQKVPVSLVYRKDKFKKDGTNPIYQYGYGSYGITLDPYFSPSRISLLDRGFVFVLTHVRGSQILGRSWYEDGKMFNKMNTFTDFIDVTKGLVAMGYGDKNKVFAGGGSAGGLLMGAIVNMAPELYLAIGAHVPFVDVVTTMSDESIPLTTGEYGEWGNPANKDSYEYMLSYSPYDQVRKQDYPHMLVTTGLHDSQVQYFEPMKWVAKLRDYKTDNNKLLLFTNMDAGHGGASGRFEGLKLRALEMAMFMDLVGITE